MQKIVVTGGCGFIGSHLVRHLHGAYPEATIVNLDLCTYAGNPENLADLKGSDRYQLVVGDVADSKILDDVFPGADAVIHAAAESHVDRSILDAGPFLRTNVAGTETVLRAVKRHDVAQMVYVSTDEVYGDIPEPTRTAEDYPLHPSNPYAASKVAGDHLAFAHHRTYGVPVCITRGSNTYGPNQFPEKLLPFFLSRAKNDETLPMYGDGGNKREWLHATDHARGIAAAMAQGRPGTAYNLGGGNERTNLEVITQVLGLLGKPASLIKFVEDRPGHDRRYALDSTRSKTELGWEPQVDFDQGLAEAVQWYADNADWCEQSKSGAWTEFYEAQYGKRVEG